MKTEDLSSCILNASDSVSVVTLDCLDLLGLLQFLLLKDSVYADGGKVGISTCLVALLPPEKTLCVQKVFCLCAL